MDGHFFDQERTIEFPVKSGWKSGNSIIIMVCFLSMGKISLKLP